MWIEWIGLAAAVAGAGASVLAGLRLWRDSRQRAAAGDPVVECGHGRQADGSLTLDLLVRNRGPAAIVVARARLVRPRRARITGRPLPGSPSGFAPATGREAVIDRVVPPAGSPDPTARLHLNVQARPPWRAGRLKVDLWIVERSAAARKRRITIERTIGEERG